MTRPDTATEAPSVPTGELLPIADPAQTWAVLRGEFASSRLSVVLTVLTATAAAATALVAPWMLGVLVDAVNDGQDVASLTNVVIILVAAALAAAALTGVGTVLVARLGNTILANLRERVVHKTMHLPTATAERIRSGDLLSRVGDDVSVVSEAIIATGPQLINSLLTVLLTGVGLFALDWRLGLAGLIAVPAYYLSLRWYLPRSGPFYAKERVAMGERSEALVGSLRGSATVTAYGLTESHVGVIGRRSEDAMNLSLGVFRLFTRFASRNNRAECVGLVTVLVVGFFLVDANLVTVGATTAAALYFHRLFNPIGALVSNFDEIQSAGASLARLAGVTLMPSAVEPTEPPQVLDAGLALTGVSHHYDGPTVVRDVNIRIAPGEKVALVGTSGAGKTTIAAIAAGVVLPTAGTVRLGGAELSALPDREVRSSIALISQEVHVFNGTLAEDLRLARPDATDDDLRAALAVVSADEWTATLPDGLETRVGENAHRLTAAQAQQLALARVVLADPPVVILDEATAEAGSAGARRLEQAALAATEGRTTLVVAHRLTQAEQADRVIVVDQGQVVEEGSHAELLAAAGPYRDLWRSWTGVKD
ncbi:ABC transporter ATP-binding protein [Stackebrandtia soli]|uniref:ABC transporter ATP-binding protein n=1 Tax=Stackebrandtia soli TaxID=1892856 RepID=UPI0039EBB33F